MHSDRNRKLSKAYTTYVSLNIGSVVGYGKIYIFSMFRSNLRQCILLFVLTVSKRDLCMETVSLILFIFQCWPENKFIRQNRCEGTQ